MALFEDDKKKSQQTEAQEELKILATHLEVLNQRLSGGQGGASSVSPADIEKFRQMTDYQHNFIVTTVNQKEQTIVKAVNANLATLQKNVIDAIDNLRIKFISSPKGESGGPLNSIPQQELKVMVNAIENFKNDTIQQIAKTNALNQLREVEQHIVKEINQYRDVNIELDKKVTRLTELLSDTLMVLREQNRVLQREAKDVASVVSGPRQISVPDKQAMKSSAKKLIVEAPIKNIPSIAAVENKEIPKKEEISKKELEKKKMDILRKIREARNKKN